MANQTHRYETPPQQQQWHVQNQAQNTLETIKDFIHNNAPSTPQTLAIITILPLSAFLLFLGGLALTGSVIGLTVTAPLFILFSPIIVPAVLTVAFAVMGVLASGAFGLMGVSAVSWIANYVKFMVAESHGFNLEHVTRRVLETVGQKVTDVGRGLSDKAHESSGYSAHDR